MSTSRSNGAGPPAQTYFEQQRAALIGDIAQNMEHVFQNINLLNRSLESVIAVGNEFSQVEGLWSQFENVMAAPPTTSPTAPPPGATTASASDLPSASNAGGAGDGAAP